MLWLTIWRLLQHRCNLRTMFYLRCAVNLVILCFLANGANAQKINNIDKNNSEVYFTKANTTSLNLFNAAKASSRSHLSDSTLKILSIIVNRNDRKFFDAIISDPDFKKLHGDKRWGPLLSSMESSQKRFNAPVFAELIAMQKDQLDMEERRCTIILQFGIHSTHYQLYQDSIRQSYLINSLKIKTIIHTYGWPGPAAVDDDGIQSLLFLFQRLKVADQKKYYP